MQLTPDAVAFAQEVQKHTKVGKALIIHVQHDQWCGVFQPQGICNCTPAYVLLDDEGTVLETQGKSVCKSTLETYVASMKGGEK
ncbi:hypothetical protein [Marivivens sp. JLT3646]|uniref:hypothetical protein n=1 Tax=Marivivens sp. JLT3646 TaxID=1920883 RepID=UPI0007FE6CFF|nr:hypothetical protein [Marivivens sp. JLT3646]APO85659.1 hypothetical protein BSK21_00595 [Marivivens sp. JLT3646]OBR35589.1 hypothetical protein A9199_11190 [Donghicola sp. JL3646]